MPQREFAYLYWDRPSMRRYIGYYGSDAVISDLIMNAPRHAYHSAAYYAKPSVEAMDKKGILGCEFVIDIDADHLPTPCNEIHNLNICQQCRQIYPGEKPEACSCGSTKFDKIVWICDTCLGMAKQQIFNLIDHFLIKDFGIPIEDLKIYFSGHWGYHVHIKSEFIRSLDQDARREMVDYVMGQGFSFRVANFEKVQGGMHGFHTDQIGWPGKIAQELLSVLRKEDPEIEEIFKAKLNPSVIRLLLENKQYLITLLNNKKTAWQVKGFGEKIWLQIFEVLKDRLKADLDTVVSIDLHRLIRLEGSINGKTGFIVNEIPYDHLRSFDPLVESLSFPYPRIQCI